MAKCGTSRCPVPSRDANWETARWHQNAWQHWNPPLSLDDRDRLGLVRECASATWIRAVGFATFIQIFLKGRLEVGSSGYWCVLGLAGRAPSLRNRLGSRLASASAEATLFEPDGRKGHCCFTFFEKTDRCHHLPRRHGIRHSRKSRGPKNTPQEMGLRGFQSWISLLRARKCVDDRQSAGRLATLQID